MQSKEQIIVLLAVFSLLFGFVGAWAYSLTQGTQTNENLVFEYYQSENAVSVSPTDFIREMQNGRTPGLAVDLRSAAEYEKAHLASSVNIPASGMTPEQLVAAFKALPQDKPIITYCYSSYCMLSRKVGKTLSENGVFVNGLRRIFKIGYIP